MRTGTTLHVIANKSRPLFRMAVLAASAFSLSACSTGSLFDSDTPQPKGYVLAAVPAAQKSATPIPVDVSVSRPDLGAGLDSDRIAVLKGRQLDYYRGVRWGARAIELVQNLVVDSLEDQSLFRSVATEQARVAGDYVLDLQVRDFQAVYSEGSDTPSVRVSMVGRIIRVTDRELVGTVTAQAEAQAESDRMSAVAAAFETASHRTILELGQQLVSAITSDRSSLRTTHDDAGAR
jgi:cholesterol transport system auxiliary component